MEHSDFRYVYVLLFLTFIPCATAYVNDTSAFYCFNCTDCTDALNNNTYNLTYLNNSLNKSSTCLNPSTLENKTLDCNGYSITGNNTEFGVYVNGTNATVKNCVVNNFSVGIYSNAFASFINNNSVSINGISCDYTEGIYLNYSANNTISNNTIRSNRTCSGAMPASSMYQIRLSYSDNNTIVNNDAGESMIYINFTAFGGASNFGLFLEYSHKNQIANNSFDYNKVTCMGSTYNCIILSNSGAFIDYSDNNTIINNTANYNDKSGISLSDSKNSIVTNNTANHNLEPGIYVNGQNTTLVDNTANYNGVIGYSIDSSQNSILINNDAFSNDLGIGVSSSPNSTISANTIKNNKRSFSITSSGDTLLSSNNISRNLISISNFSTDSQEGFVGSYFYFNYTVRQINGSLCPDCSYELILSPNESTFTHSVNGSLISGYFVPTKTGIYSLKITVTDPQNNIEEWKRIFLINATNSTMENYYLRSTRPTHSQPYYDQFYDTGSMLKEQPTSEENRTCTAWIWFVQDVLPTYLFGSYKNISYSIRYTSGLGTVGLDRHGYYDSTVFDMNVSLPSAALKRANFSFVMNWTNDYFWQWYKMGIKMKRFSGAYPMVFTNSTNLSYVNITYTYSTTPAIKNITNEAVDVLSATMPSDRNEAIIVLDGEGTTNMTIQMPSTASYYVLYDGLNCSLPNCSYNQDGNEFNFTVTVGSVHNITIGVPKDNGLTCTDDVECSSTYCVHNYCRAENVYCGDAYCDPGEDCSSCATDCGPCRSGAGTSSSLPVSASSCANNSECAYTQKCVSSKCVNISCECGHILNHECINYECCDDNNCVSGYECVNNVCVAKEVTLSGQKTNIDESGTEQNTGNKEQTQGVSLNQENNNQNNYNYLIGVVILAIFVLLYFMFTRKSSKPFSSLFLKKH